MRDPLDIAVVGAGAAGLATAIFAARRRPDLAVAVIDSARAPGAKILVSGGGRCNVTNAAVAPRDYWGGSRAAIRRVLDALPVAATVDFFRGIGVALHEEPGGKLFPDTNRARTVLDALVAEASRRGVRLITGRRVEAVTRRDGLFDVGGLAARRVVLATGGMSLPKSGSDGGGYSLARSLGHTIVPPVPALVPLVLDGDVHAALAGVSQETELTVRVDGKVAERVRGSMLWTHFGVSGPAAMDASRFWHRAKEEGREVAVAANFLPGLDLAAVDRWIAAARGDAKPEGVLSERLPARLASALARHAGVIPATRIAHLTRDARRTLARAVVEFPLPVRGGRGWNYAEVTAGGVPLAEINPSTMESRRCPGLHLVGEILDVDGRIGGFNFQWAWSGGFAAARGAAGPP